MCSEEITIPLLMHLGILSFRVQEEAKHGAKHSPSIPQTNYCIAPVLEKLYDNDYDMARLLFVKVENLDVL